MAVQEHTGPKRTSGLFLACALTMSLAVIGCGSLAAASRDGGPAGQQVVRDPENPHWIGATLTTSQLAQTTQVRDPENPYWAGNTLAASADAVDSQRQRGPR